jgi:hypothetical protein
MPAEVAFVVSSGGVIQWAAESTPHDGCIVKRRPVSPGTIAHRLGASGGVPGEIVRGSVEGQLWGTGGRVVEASVWTDYSVVLSWIRRGE